MQWMREELEDLAFKRPEPRRPPVDHPPLHHPAARNRRRDPPDHRRHASTSWKKPGSRPKSLAAPRNPIRSGARCRRRIRVSRAFLTSTASASSQPPRQTAIAPLGAIHQRWRAVPGRFKDYISQPKSNGYRSIHTTVSGRDGKRVEVQIRTRQMHDVAETGVAAHWSYRDGVRSENPFAVDPAKWIAIADRAVRRRG